MDKRDALFKRLVAAGEPATELKPGRAYLLSVQHDDGCPTLTTQSMSDCTCTDVEERLVEVDGP